MNQTVNPFVPFQNLFGLTSTELCEETLPPFSSCFKEVTLLAWADTSKELGGGWQMSD